MTRPVRNYKWKDGKTLFLGDVSLVMTTMSNRYSAKKARIWSNTH